MSKKLERKYHITQNQLDKIKELSSEKNISYSQVVGLAIDHLYKNKEQEYHLMKNMFSELIDEKLSHLHEVLNKVWVTGNVIDKNTKMEQEFWNHYFLVEEPDVLGSTEKYKSEQLIEAEKLIKDRIAHNRQRKLEWEEKRKKVSTES